MTRSADEGKRLIVGNSNDPAAGVISGANDAEHVPIPQPQEHLWLQFAESQPEPALAAKVCAE